MGLILPGFVLASVAIVLWSVVASRKRVAGPASIRENLAVGVAVLLGLAATIWLLLAPSYAWSSESQTAGGVTSSRATGTGTLLGANGLSALIPLLVPMVLLGAAAVGRRSAARRTITLAAAIVLTAFVVVASFSIGLFFLPAAVPLGGGTRRVLYRAPRLAGVVAGTADSYGSRHVAAPCRLCWTAAQLGATR